MGRISSDQRIKDARDYAIREPSFTAAFMAWELGWHPSVAHMATNELHRLGIIKQIEKQKGPFAAVYQYDDTPKGSDPTQRRSTTHEERQELGIGQEAPKRGDQIPYVTTRGSTQKPGKDRKLQERGVRIKPHTS